MPPRPCKTSSRSRRSKRRYSTPKPAARPPFSCNSSNLPLIPFHTAGHSVHRHFHNRQGSLYPQMTSTTNSSFSVSAQQAGATTSTVPSPSFGASLLESLPPIPGSGPATPAVTGENQGQLGSPSASTVLSPNPTTTSATTFGGVGGLGTPGSNLGLRSQKQSNGLSSTFGGSGLNTQPTRLGALNSQQPLRTGLGGGFGSGFSTANGLSPQMADAQGGANPFRMTMFSNNASMPAFGGGLGANPGLGLGGGFSGGFGGLPGTPFGQITNSQPQPQRQQQGSLI